MQDVGGRWKEEGGREREDERERWTGRNEGELGESFRTVKEFFG